MISPFCDEPVAALKALGLDVRMPHANIQGTLTRVLPVAASRGYFPALKAALDEDPQLSGDTGRQLDWLAGQLRLGAGSGSVWSWWAASWAAAAARIAPIRPPQQLAPAQTRVLLDWLIETPIYRARVEDGLVRALAVT